MYNDEQAQDLLLATIYDNRRRADAHGLWEAQRSRKAAEAALDDRYPLTLVDEVVMHFD